ncbi:MAG: hypothetical protein Q8M03_06395 [Legionella sp.]|nr:hypothetical protein [Legionella sp.]
MALVNVIVAGEEGSGKTSFLRYIEDPRTAKLSLRPLDIECADVHTWDANFHFWDASIDGEHQNLRILIYCVDLSKASLDEKKVIAEIEQLKEKNPQAVIYLVGTKMDIADKDTVIAFDILCENDIIDYGKAISVLPKMGASRLRLHLFQLGVEKPSPEDEIKRQKLLSDIDIKIQSLSALQTQVEQASFKIKLQKLEKKFKSLKSSHEISEEKQSTDFSVSERDRFFLPAEAQLQQGTSSNTPTSGSHQ